MPSLVPREARTASHSFILAKAPGQKSISLSCAWSIVSRSVLFFTRNLRERMSSAYSELRAAGVLWKRMSPLTWGMRWKRRWKPSAGSLGPTQTNVRGLTMAAETLLRLVGH
eukprot:3545063-Alexandrium_andersonii.AAC.1